MEEDTHSRAMAQVQATVQAQATVLVLATVATVEATSSNSRRPKDTVLEQLVVQR